MTFLAVRPRFSTVLFKFSHNYFYFIRVSPPTPWRLSPGAVRSPALLVTPLGAGPEMWGGTVPPKTMNVAGFYLLLL